MALISLMVSHSQTYSETVLVFFSFSSPSLASPSSLISSSSFFSTSSPSCTSSSFFSSSSSTCFLTSLETKSLIGYWMNSEYFLTRFLILSYSTYSTASSFKCRVTRVPLPRVSPLGSFVTKNLASAVDVHTCYSSSLALDVTTTLLATKKAE
jgi:hypothetical protein